jgi:hypothetical protein
METQMPSTPIGISSRAGISPLIVKKSDFIEIKKITLSEASYFRQISSNSIFFHLQYSSSGEYILSTADNFQNFSDDFISAWEFAHPPHVSFHFGLSASKISIDPEYFIAVADSPPLTEAQIIGTIEKNLHFLKDAFRQSNILLENLEFIPEALSKGAYRYIPAAPFFTKNVNRWHEEGVLDGIVFDIAHGLITSGNHPFYNGLSAAEEFNDPIQTDELYIEKLKRKSEKDLLGYYSTYISQMPLELLKEIHISGISRTRSGVWIDAHNEIGELEINALAILLQQIGEDRSADIPITLEYTRKEEKIPLMLDTLRRHTG